MRFVRLVECAANSQADALSVGMLGEDQKGYRFDVAADCAALFIVAMAAEMGKLDAASGDQQFIVGKGVTTALSDQGGPMLILTLASGAELPIALEGGSLRELIDQLQGLSGGIAPGQTH